MKMVDAITAQIKVFVKRLYNCNFTRFLSKYHEVSNGKLAQCKFSRVFLATYRRKRSVRVVCTRLEKIHQHISESTKAKGMLASNKYLVGSLVGSTFGPTRK